MGTTHGGGSGSWRNEHVISASYHTRPLNTASGLQHVANHHGVVVNTAEGNSYLIHHPKDGITTVTFAQNMSNKWSKDHDIKVNGSKTVQEVYNGAGGRTTNSIVNYVTGGTCIGVASNAEKTLKK